MSNEVNGSETRFIELLHEIYPELAYYLAEVKESVYKVQERYSIFAGRNLPSFIKDWLIKRFTDDDGELYADDLLNFLNIEVLEKICLA